MKKIAKNIDREMGTLIILLLLVILLWFINFQMSNNLYINSLNINKIEQQNNTLSHENNQLYLIYLQKASYRNISQKAKLSGFIPVPIITP